MKYPITYQYINALLGSVFADVHTDGKALPAELESSVQRLAVTNVVLEPNTSIDEVYTYYTQFDCRDAKSGAPSMPVSLFTRCSRVKDTVQVAKNTQCVGWSWNAAMLKDSFCETVLQTRFYTDREVDSFTDRKAPAITDSVSIEPLSGEELSDRAIKAIFFGLMTRWKKGGKPICVAVPEGKNYTKYVLSAVAAIYAYFPIRMRAELGFSSYQTAAERNSPRKRSIYLCFVPAKESDADTIFLDGKTSTAGIDTYINRGADNSRLDSFVNYICKLSPDERERLIADIYEIIEGGDSATPEQLDTFSVYRYGELAEAIKLQDKDGPYSELLPAWEHFYAHPDKYPASMIPRLKKHIHEKMSVDDFERHIDDTLKDESSENIFAFFKGIVCFLTDPDNEPYAKIANAKIMDLLDNRLKLSAGDKYIKIKENQPELRAVISRDDVANVAAVYFMQQLEELKDEKGGVILNTAEEYGPFIESVKSILRDCDGLVNTAALLECIGEIKTFRRQLIDEQNSKSSKSDIEKREALETEGYFEFLEKYHAFSVKYTHDEYIIKSLNELEARRQAELEKLSFAQYSALYQQSFGSPITRDSLVAVGAAQFILDDLRRFDEAAFVVDTEGEAEYIYAQILQKLALLKLIHGEERSFEQRILGHSLSCDKALAILGLNSEQLEKSDFKIITELVKAGSYKTRDVVKLLGVYRTLEADTDDYIQLIAAVDDTFEAADDSEYEQSAACIYRAMLSNCGLSAAELTDVLSESITSGQGKSESERMFGLSKWLWIIVKDNRQAWQRDEDYAELQKTKGRLETDLLTLQENYTKLFSENQQLEHGRQTLRDENTELKSKNEALDRDLSILGSEKNRLELEKTQLEAQQDELSEKNRSLKIKVETLTAEKTRLENNKSWLEGEKSRLESEVKELEAKKKELTQKLSGVTDAKASVEKEKNELERKLSDAREQLERIEKESAGRQSQITDLNAELSGAKTAKRESEKSAAALSKALEGAKAEITKLRSDNSSLKQKLRDPASGNHGINLKYIIPMAILGIALILACLFGFMQRNRNVELVRQNEQLVFALEEQTRLLADPENVPIEDAENVAIEDPESETIEDLEGMLGEAPKDSEQTGTESQNIAP